VQMVLPAALDAQVFAVRMQQVFAVRMQKGFHSQDATSFRSQDAISFRSQDAIRSNISADGDDRANISTAATRQK